MLLTNYEVNEMPMCTSGMKGVCVITTWIYFSYPGSSDKDNHDKHMLVIYYLPDSCLSRHLGKEGEIYFLRQSVASPQMLDERRAQIGTAVGMWVQACLEKYNV